ncbi:unnamed protein product [Sphagnum balticum]
MVRVHMAEVYVVLNIQGFGKFEKVLCKQGCGKFEAVVLSTQGAGNEENVKKGAGKEDVVVEKGGGKYEEERIESDFVLVESKSLTADSSEYVVSWVGPKSYPVLGPARLYIGALAQVEPPAIALRAVILIDGNCIVGGSGKGVEGYSIEGPPLILMVLAG